jgi:3-oxoacyl-[acyl-carrier-protein] synthase-3
MSASSGSRAAVLAGLGTWLPPRLVTNEELAERLDVTDEWIRSRTGITQRYMAEPGMATSDLAVEAGRRALASAGTDRVDAVVVATNTPDYPTPPTATDVATRLGQPCVGAFDLTSACSSFVYGLTVSASLVAAGTVDSVLYIGADTWTCRADPGDPRSYVLFGDGAGAVVLRAGHPDEPGSLGAFHLGSDGRGRELSIIRAGGSRQLLSGKPPAEADHYFSMNGKAIFKHAVLRMAETTQTVLDSAGWRLDQLDWLVCHQANRRIVTGVAAELGLPVERCVCNIDRVANTVSASIPLALADAVAAGSLRPGHRVVIVAFGGGLTWGGTALRWPEIELAED